MERSQREVASRPERRLSYGSAPFDGPLTLGCRGKLHAISHELAAAVAIL
jgi:hypothetical protein